MTAGEMSLENKVHQLQEKFREIYGDTPLIFRAPGRVNLIGEHTDYNDGFVMPAAIDFYTWVAASPRTDGALHIRSLQYKDAIQLTDEELAGPPRKHWTDYVRGMAHLFELAGVPYRGANLLINGEVPVGAGLSSSAALELSTGLALLGTAHANFPRRDLVKLAQRAENQYAGAMCGIMDQFIAGFGHAGNAILLDCRSLDYSLLPIPDNVRLVICNSMVKHDLATGEYNARRSECAEAVKILQRSFPQVHALRDATMEMLEATRSEFSDVVYRRARHVITEDDRVLRSADALRAHRLEEFGRLMFESHKSLRDDYEVSAVELDLLVELAANQQGLLGARMTGGGFGGCTINLVSTDAVEQFRQVVAEAYQSKTGHKPDIFVCTPAEGAEQITIEEAH